jgi:hypothetical protein
MSELRPQRSWVWILLIFGTMFMCIGMLAMLVGNTS